MSKSSFSSFLNMSLAGYTDEESGDIIQLITPDDNLSSKDDEVPENLPILPIRNTVLFPG